MTLDCGAQWHDISKASHVYGSGGVKSSQVLCLDVEWNAGSFSDA